MNGKTGTNRWIPDIRPDEIETVTETNGDQTAEYKVVPAHPILSGVLDKLAFFRTHAAAVWYNKLTGQTVKSKLDDLDTAVDELNENLAKKAVANHVHNYAGSTNSGGSATSAVKLDTASAGSATRPIYFSGGKPVQCTYTLEKSVPVNAVFTDTNTPAGIGFKNVYQEIKFVSLGSESYGYIQIPSGKSLLNVILNTINGSPAIRCTGITKNSEEGLYTAWINASINDTVALHYTYI